MNDLLGWLCFVMLGLGLLVLCWTIGAKVARADCLYPWAETRWHVDPVPGAVAYDWLEDGTLAWTSTQPAAIGPCPTGTVSVRAVFAGGVRSDASDEHQPVRCQGLVPEDGLYPSQFEAWDASYMAGELVCPVRR